MRRSWLTFIALMPAVLCGPLARPAAAQAPGFPSKYTVLDPPGSVGSVPTAINAQGDIVGYYYEDPCEFCDSIAHGFLFNKGVYTILDAPGAVDTYATAINTQGDIVGNYFDS